MEEPLRAHLATNAGLGVLVADRIQWDVRDETSPSVALHLIDGPPDQTLKGKSGLVSYRVQADCWGLTFLEAKAVGEALLAALPGIGQVVDGVKFHGAIHLDTERGRFGDAPNILFRTRHDIRVVTSPA
jgi:hypothetical protein